MSHSFLTDPLPLLQDLIRCRSITPEDDGALAYVGRVLEGMGFHVIFLAFGPEEAPTPNLYARLGAGAPFLCFAGHTDVVPPGKGWQHDPFGAAVVDGKIYGRGAADMKGGVACALGAVGRRLQEGPLKGSISFLITGDEEGPARFGTRSVLEWMRTQGEMPDFCVVGEPTNPVTLGDVIKIGRRGSLNAVITVKGVQGHVAYPHLADNPLHQLIPLLNDVTGHCLDTGSNWFAPSCLQVTSVDVGNPSTNVIPVQAQAKLNIRFNDHHTGESLSAWLHEVVAYYAPEAELEIAISGEAFLTEPREAVEQLVASVEAVTGIRPQFDTGGGTSDARFITKICPVAEFGLVNETIHKCDEHVSVESLEGLTRIYHDFMGRFGV